MDRIETNDKEGAMKDEGVAISISNLRFEISNQSFLCRSLVLLHSPFILSILPLFILSSLLNITRPDSNNRRGGGQCCVPGD